jgi:endonuclease/exonuclease/phosphatase (EEP) superfamily protein YafD
MLHCFMMKIIFLNCLHGKLQAAIHQFIKEQAADTDVFCFQEAGELIEPLGRDILTSFRWVSAVKPITEEKSYSLVTFVRDNRPILSSETILKDDPGIGVALSTQIKTDREILNIVNFHGVPEPGDKLDTPERLQQSRELLDYLATKEGMMILGGDFNLDPKTQSVRMFEENGYRNLIREYGITNTRNKYAWEAHPDRREYYSDFVFLKGDLKVSSFSVPAIEISDHLPMILKINEVS